MFSISKNASTWKERTSMPTLIPNSERIGLSTGSFRSTVSLLMTVFAPVHTWDCAVLLTMHHGLNSSHWFNQYIYVTGGSPIHELVPFMDSFSIPRSLDHCAYYWWFSGGVEKDPQQIPKLSWIINAKKLDVAGRPSCASLPPSPKLQPQQTWRDVSWVYSCVNQPVDYAWAKCGLTIKN